MRKHSPRLWYLQPNHRLAALTSIADKQLRDAQAQHKQHFDASLCRATDNVSTGDSVFVDTALANQLHTLTGARSPFPLRAVDPHTVKVQRAEKLGCEMFL